jgi:hypothetical protein
MKTDSKPLTQPGQARTKQSIFSQRRQARKEMGESLPEVKSGSYPV